MARNASSGNGLDYTPLPKTHNRVRFFDGQHWIEITRASGGGIEIQGDIPLVIIPNVSNNFIVKIRRDWSKS